MVKFARNSDALEAKRTENNSFQRHSAIEASGKSMFGDTANPLLAFHSKT